VRFQQLVVLVGDRGVVVVGQHLLDRQESIATEQCELFGRQPTTVMLNHDRLRARGPR
jgi:hypothetical protein